MPLATLADVKTLTQVAFSAEEDAAVQLILDLMEADLEQYCNRPLTVKSFTSEAATIRDDGVVFLNRHPVVSVSQVRYDTTPPTAFTGTYRVQNGLLTFNAASATTAILVDYTAGLADPVNRAAKSILLARMSRIVSKVHDDALGVSALTQEGYNAAYLEEGWTDQELKIADRNRRRVVRWGGP